MAHREKENERRPLGTKWGRGKGGRIFRIGKKGGESTIEKEEKREKIWEKNHPLNAEEKEKVTFSI